MELLGPSGSGKTTLTKIFRDEYYAFTIDADQVAREISSNKDSAYYKEVVALFGDGILKEKGKLDRGKMAVIIYNNAEMRSALNKITFKYVVDSINMQINIAKQFKYKYIVVDVPLLYEAKMETICNSVIAVIAEDEEKIARICERDKITEEDAKKRLKSQNSNEFFAKKADFVVYNNGSFEELENSLKEIIEKI